MSATVAGVVSALVLLSAVASRFTVTSPGKALHKKFVALGTVRGMSKSTFVAKVGPPSSISALADGRTLLQWQATGCHMALRFHGEICEGIVHEHLHRG